MRQYNPNIDKMYSPDDTPELYLSIQQIEYTFNKIKCFEGEDEKAVIEVIREIETLNRKEKLGQITPKECKEKIKIISNNFLDRFGHWPYITKSYKAFYQLFIR